MDRDDVDQRYGWSSSWLAAAGVARRCTQVADVLKSQRRVRMRIHPVIPTKSFKIIEGPADANMSAASSSDYPHAPAGEAVLECARDEDRQAQDDSATVIVVQSSLSTKSHTAIVAETMLQMLLASGIQTHWLNLKTLDLPFCDGRKLAEYPLQVRQTYHQLEAADAYVLAYPIYNYSFSGVLKNFLDLFSHAMDSKAVGLVSNGYSTRAWNQGSGELMKSLALHNQIQTLMPCVGTAQRDFTHGQLTNATVLGDLGQLAVRVAAAARQLHALRRAAKNSN